MKQAYADVMGTLGHAKHCLKTYPTSIANLASAITAWAPRPLPGTQTKGK